MRADLCLLMACSAAATAVIVIGALVGVVVWWRRRRRRRRGQGTRGTHEEVDGAPAVRSYEAYFALGRGALMPDSVAYVRTMQLFTSLGGAPLVGAVTRVTAVANAALVTNFGNHRKALVTRLEQDPALFRKDDWRQARAPELRAWVLHELGTRAQRWPWTAIGDAVPVIPVLHGTDADIAAKISVSGFSALSSLDAGYYGRGMYFTSDVRYALPYCATKARPCVLLCLAIPGNAYPVIEGPKDDDALVGVPVRSGYQSHYVLTTRDGQPCRQRVGAGGEFFDELVLDQEAQVVAVAIVEFDKAALAPHALAFQRTLPKA